MKIKQIHYSSSERRKMLSKGTSLNEKEALMLNVVLSGLTFSDLESVALQIKIISEGKYEELKK